ncbi:MAG TPA: PEGA domain-containing protein, partial [Kofleriaceae bacterium]|nr:PEGA domain-containing protein [Kofleriaceae bacterium]
DPSSGERASASTVDRDGLLEPTMLERGAFDEGPTMAHSPSRVRTPAPSTAEEEGPTNIEMNPQQRRLTRGSVSDGGPRPTLGRPASSPGAPPALLARSREPAVSALRAPRKSRRTPPSGVPAVGSESILQAIVGNVADSGPTAPLRGGSGVPRSVIPVDSGPPSMRTDGPPPGHYQPPQLQAPPPPQQYPQTSPPPGPIGFPLSAPHTPNPMMGLPLYDQPLVSAFPTGQPPASLTRQLAALEIDEIPAHYKIGRSSSSRWLVIVAVGVAVVAVGAVIALLIRQGSDTIPARLRIDSIPTGATVTVNGTELGERTPAFLDEVVPGKRYRVRAELAGYEPKEKEVIGSDRDVDELLYLTKIQVELVVSSKPKADLFVDSVRVGTTPYAHKYSTPPEVVELRLKGFKPERRKLDWTDKTEIRLEIPLQRN